MNLRNEILRTIGGSPFDIVIIGAGISGTAIYNTLRRQGYTVFLLDKGDFSCGTSQASAMMVWGGLLYLRNLDLAAVYRLSMDREYLLRNHGDHVTPREMCYVPNEATGRSARFVYLALHFYWMLAKALEKEGCRISAPRYPLLHQQPFFTEGVHRKILRLPADQARHVYDKHSLPQTQAANAALLKPPSFSGPDNGLLDQYAQAFEKVVTHAVQIREHVHEAA